MELIPNFCDTSCDMSEEEIVIKNNERTEGSAPQTSESEQRCLEKRVREDSAEDDEGFIKVQRAPKRRARSYSDNYQESMECRFCIISKEELPKQFGMAKLLRSENITGISRINYKNPFKVIISFENRECGNKLMECEKLLSLGCRIQPADEVFLSYGIVRQVDLEETDEEILKNIKSEFDIVSVRRLRRLTNTGTWVNSETIRLAFRSSILPAYVFGFGCRFKVEKYTFPVTQCSGCWRFGHQVRSCPSKKVICPKCGNNHDNCETVNFKCINCKGQHMAMYKKCPTFLKEKEIREIMTEKNCTYRNALKIYYDKMNAQDINSESLIWEDDGEETGIHKNIHRQNYRSYRDVVVEAEIHSNISMEQDDGLIGNQYSEPKTLNRGVKVGKNKQKTTRKTEKQADQQQSSQFEQKIGESTEQSGEEQAKKKKGYEKSFGRQLLDIFKNIVNICQSSNNMETKLALLGNLLIKEIWQIIINFVQSGAVCKQIISVLFNG